MYNATMMAYGPVENPEIAVAIVAEKSGNGYYLAETVRGIFEEYYRLKELRQNPDWREMIDENAVISDENTAEAVGGNAEMSQGQQNSVVPSEQGVQQPATSLPQQ